MFLHLIHRSITAARIISRAFISAIGLRPRLDADTARLRLHYRAALAALPDDQRTVFTLHRIEDLSIVDIAARLNMPTSLVEENLAAALLAIAAAVDAHR